MSQTVFQALIAAMLYSFARVSAVLKLKLDDYYHNGARRWLRLHEKGGKEHEMPVHHLLDETLNKYIIGTPEEIAHAIIFISSDKASFIIGASLAVDGGQTSD